MSKQVQDLIARGEARIVEAPEAKSPARDRSFGLPSALYGGTVACYLGFIGVMAMAFANPALAIPLTIFALFIVAGFGVPAIFTRLKGNDIKPLTLGQFENVGIVTHTGRLAPRDAAVQVLLLPVLVLFWGLTAAIIAAFVS
jgi:ABC-type dipeptide/oligopeptide/nickel transport system permease subunit